MSELSVARRVQIRLLSPRLVRWLAPALYVAALSAYMWRDGIPVGRERLLLWIVLGLLALSTANLVGWLRSVVFEWLPLALVLAVYDLLRGHADGLLFSAWYRPQLEADSFLFGGTVPTVWFRIGSGTGRRTCTGTTTRPGLVYVSYFLATYVVAGLLWFVDRGALSAVRCLCRAPRDAWRSPRSRSSPPRRRGSRARQGELDPTSRLIGPISGHIPFVSFSFEELFQRGWEYSNPVAAVPSLHAAYTLLVTLFLWRVVARWARPLLALYPLAMAFALVYTAEHYLFDVLLGWAYTLVAVWVVSPSLDRYNRPCVVVEARVDLSECQM